MLDFINLIKKDLQVQKQKRDLLDKDNRLPYNFQSKQGYDTLIRNVILKQMINLLATIIVDIDVKLKLKFSGIKYLESRVS